MSPVALNVRAAFAYTERILLIHTADLSLAQTPTHHRDRMKLSGLEAAAGFSVFFIYGIDRRWHLSPTINLFRCTYTS